MDEVTPEQQKEALARIEAKLSQINKLYEECGDIADEFQVDFYVDGPSYGMGGSYTPRSVKALIENGYLDEDEVAEMDEDEINDYLDEHSGWNASSQSC